VVLGGEASPGIESPVSRDGTPIQCQPPQGRPGGTAAARPLREVSTLRDGRYVPLPSALCDHDECA